jgi:hypothetical protein
MTILELMGRVITDAACDGDTMSLVLDNGGILQIASLVPSRCSCAACDPVLHYEIEFPLCAQGIHSWADAVGKLPADFKCEWCGEEYGEVD